MASVLTNQLVDLGANTGYDISPNLLRGAATGYTRSSAFPGQYGTANRILHRWMFTDTVAQTDESGRAGVDLSPMLADTSFQQTLQEFGIQPPSTLSVPLTENASDSLRPGRLRQLATWGPWVSIGAAVLTGVFALLTIAVARKRGKALAALGVSALLVGATGWAPSRCCAPGSTRRWTPPPVTSGRSPTQWSATADRQPAPVAESHAGGGRRAGGLGIVVSMLGGLRRSE